MPIADTLLRLARQGIFRPFWSEQILAEVARTLSSNRFGIAPPLVEKRINVMKAHFPEAMVHSIDDISLNVALPDPDDAHVLAAAVIAGADAIVTVNLRQFPVNVCDRYGLEILDPDTFLINQFDLDPELVCNELLGQSFAMRIPPVPLHDLLDRLRVMAPRFVKMVEDGPGDRH
jgi:predicted nucleic acid-binding protein